MHTRKAPDDLDAGLAQAVQIDVRARACRSAEAMAGLARSMSSTAS